MGVVMDVSILVGGQAFQKNPDLYKEIGADILTQTYEDICRLPKRHGS